LEWRPLIHLLFDSIKPVGGVGRVILNSNGVAKGAEAPIFGIQQGLRPAWFPAMTGLFFGVHLNWSSDVATGDKG
jgi:hypothetical protein